MLKILSWNIRQGGGTRVAKIAMHIRSFNAEIVVLSEYRNNDSGMRLRGLMLSYGYRFQHVSHANASDNSVAIFSKLPCNQWLYPNADPSYTHNIIASEFPAFKLYGMYLPHKKKHTLFDFLLDEATKPEAGIMVGDFNSGINGVDQAGDSFWYEDKLKALSRLGYRDAFRVKQGAAREYSWYSHQGNGYRYDHTYVHESLLPIIKDCYYIHTWREEKLSDHSPMVLELG